MQEIDRALEFQCLEALLQGESSICKSKNFTIECLSDTKIFIQEYRYPPRLDECTFITLEVKEGLYGLKPLYMRGEYFSLNLDKVTEFIFSISQDPKERAMLCFLRFNPNYTRKLSKINKKRFSELMTVSLGKEDVLTQILK